MTILACGSRELKKEDRQLYGDILEGNSSIADQTERVKEFIDRCQQLASALRLLQRKGAS
jgi:hypothetical protein